MGTKIKGDPNRPATKKQLWALFCMTKEDHRDKGLTISEASKMIGELKAAKKKKYPGCVDIKTGKKVKVTTKGMVEYEDADCTGGAKKLVLPEFLWSRAKKAGDAALEACAPTPMVVQQHANPMDDDSPVEKSWFVEGGVCGFATIHVKLKTKNNRTFINGLKRAGICSSDENARTEWNKHGYYGGFYYHVSEGGQSMARKEAFANAAVEVLRKHGVEAYMMSRMD